MVLFLIVLSLFPHQSCILLVEAEGECVRRCLANTFPTVLKGREKGKELTPIENLSYSSIRLDRSYLN